MRHRMLRSLAAACLALLLAVAAGPAPAAAPAPVQTAQLFDAAAMARDEHPKIVAQFGGEYHDPAVRDYVRALGDDLVNHTELAGQKFTFTVLNSDIVNAFALPGGYVYVTRGLMALADNEAELAGVLSHEIGHVVARHGEKRMTNTLLAQIGIGLLGAAIDSAALNNLLQVGALAVLSGYSREQEFEADTLGVRYLARAGYDPEAMAGFLGKLKSESDLQAAIAGREPGSADQFNIMATHPRTADRVNRAIELARTSVRIPARPRLGVDDYMHAIDGLYYNGDPENGIVKGRQFSHPKLRFAFDVPPGFSIINSAEQVIAAAGDNTQIVFDLAERPRGASMPQYVGDVWGQKLSLGKVESIVVNGLDAATGAARLDTNQGARDVRLVAMDFGDARVARFLFVTPPERTEPQSVELRRTTYSFRKLSPAEAEAIRPLRLRATRVRQGETVEGYARRMPFESHQVDRFQVLNGLQPGQPLRAGQWLKYVADGE